MEAIGGGDEEIDLGGRSVPVRQYASWFNFKGADQQKKVGVLSGTKLCPPGTFMYSPLSNNGLDTVVLGSCVRPPQPLPMLACCQLAQSTACTQSLKCSESIM